MNAYTQALLHAGVAVPVDAANMPAVRTPVDTEIGRALNRAELAKDAMHRASQAGAKLPNEDAFGKIEAEFLDSRKALGRLLSETLGVDFRRAVECFV